MLRLRRVDIERSGEVFDRIKTLMELNRFGIPVEPVGYTPQEFESMQERRNPFIMEVTEKGKVSYPYVSPNHWYSKENFLMQTSHFTHQE